VRNTPPELYRVLREDCVVAGAALVIAAACDVNAELVSWASTSPCIAQRLNSWRCCG
jgi:hypothetical protein